MNVLFYILKNTIQKNSVNLLIKSLKWIEMHKLTGIFTVILVKFKGNLFSNRFSFNLMKKWWDSKKFQKIMIEVKILWPILKNYQKIGLTQKKQSQNVCAKNDKLYIRNY